MSIATKTGDQGETSLMYGRRVSKTDRRVEAYGCVDELNSALGLVRATASASLVAEQILSIQKELVTVMGELATAPEDLARYEKDGFSLTTESMVDRLTAAIDDLEKDKTLYGKGWAMPGNTLLAAALDLARTICRRTLPARQGDGSGRPVVRPIPTAVSRCGGLTCLRVCDTTRR